MKNFKFVEPTCYFCKAHNDKYIGSRYCEGGKRPRYFRKSDPKRKAPKWCPKRKSPAEVKVYGFVDENAKNMHFTYQKPNCSILALAYHYKLIFTATGFANAGDFYQKANSEPIEQLIDCDFEYGNIVEIDDGLKSYFFYCKGYAIFEEVYFNPSKKPPDAARGKDE